MNDLKDTVTIRLHDTLEGQQLFGPHDSFLRLIEDGTDAKIITRSEELIISGTSDEINRLRELFQMMLRLIRRGYSLAERDVNYAINLSKRGMLDELIDLFEEEIGITFRQKPIRAKTLGQKHYVTMIRKKDIVFGIGPAGTGKTYLAVVMAVMALKRGEVKRIILTRPAVEAGESLGFLPGDLQEKVDPYLRPLYDALYDVMGAEAVARFMEKGIIEVAPLAYMRGRTLDDSFVILDEAQNTTPEQMKMFLTRLGFGSKMVVTGDITQIDLPRGKRSGLIEAQRILSSIQELAFVYFQESDVVRHSLVQKIIQAYQQQV
ncbi:PhoH family protein [Microaerobacter geothermalis]|uniref:PhoH family protein n=1 Tax=Microaerobacter geothermalis TaxID=674972 RepID=UPI001F43DE9F|nr:PhoH family protein [Microaerobacter geothermalis]MCF6092825.1 PhoH family protein [Microaerobacter geothermalis]